MSFIFVKKSVINLFFLTTLTSLNSNGKADITKQINILMPAPFQESTKELINEFNEKNIGKIKVRVTKGPRETEAVSDLAISSLLLGNSPYDGLLIDVTWLPKYAQAGWITDLSKWFSNDEYGELESGAQKGNKYNSVLYRWPFVADIGLLYWRTDLMEMPPRTPVELMNISKELQRKRLVKYGYVWQGRQYEGLSCVFLELVKGFGGDWLSKTGKVELSNEKTIAAVKWLKSLLDSKVSPIAVTNFSEPEALQTFKNGDAAFMRNWPYAWKELHKDDSKVIGKVGITTMVSTDDNQPVATLGSWGFSIISTSKNKNETAKLIKFLTSDYAQQKLFRKYGYTPTRKSTFRSTELRKEIPIIQELQKALNLSKPRPMTPVYAQISDVLQRHLSSVLSDNKDVRIEMMKAKSTTQKILDSTGLIVK